MALPFHYPRLSHLDAWQSGFRQHGLTGESLLSCAPGAWQPGWQVIALNGFDDPFFIDLGEQARGFAVYYAPLGAGRWDASEVAPNILRFGELLSALRDLAHDAAAALHYLESETGLNCALWREVHEERRSRPALEAELAHHDTPHDPHTWQRGTLVLIDAGPQRIKVAQVLKQLLGLSPQGALALMATGDVILAEGHRVHLSGTQAQLSGLGATLEFRAQDPSP
ncbi:hypothetical protein [Pseudomonas sp.]|uniref:hypothetical protein n=1 Tax=Pseudomonas sp. TaxID=306 RepID=UPI003396D138